MPSLLAQTRPGSMDLCLAEGLEARQVHHDVWMSVGSTNTYLVTTQVGNVLINTGLGIEAPVHQRCYRRISQGPLKAIVLTQGHLDLVGGVDQMREPGTVVYAHRNMASCQDDDARLQGFRNRRNMRFFPDMVAPMLKAQAEASKAGWTPPQARAEPDVLIDAKHDFEVGGTCFELIWVPGGETIDSILVWLPEQRVLFTGNALGPLFPHMPNFHTIRGDRLRFALPFLAACDTILALQPELLLTGHFEPVSGTELICTEVQRLRDAVQYVHDETVRGMNEGLNPYELMKRIRLPDHLQVGEDYGTVPWAVRAIWHGYGGWFYFDSTTELGDSPAREIYAELAALAGAEAVAAKAAAMLAQGQVMQAIHLAEVALAGESEHRGAMQVYLAAHERLLAQVSPRNRWWRMWIEGEIAQTSRRLEP